MPDKTTSDARAPLAILADYQARALASRAATPVERDALPEWQGVAFTIGETRYVAAMDEVVEILDPPSCTKVPGTQTWFLGLGNVRGNLVPVSDLHSFVLSRQQPGGRATIRRTARVLTCGHGESYTGMQVDDVQGLRRFYLEERHAADSSGIAALAPHVKYEFRRHGEAWPVLELGSLAESEEFLRIGQ